MLDEHVLCEDYLRLVRDGSVSRFVTRGDVSRWRAALRQRARCEGVPIRTAGRRLEPWQIKQRLKVLGHVDGDLGARIWGVSAYLPAFEELPGRDADLFPFADQTGEAWS